MEKTYDPKVLQDKYYDNWAKAGLFECHPDSDTPSFSLMMPPPNVTGRLHIGHALTFTIQDIIIRFQRMLRKDVLWQPGTDHAGIATQMVVEKNLAAQGLRRDELGRDAFLKHVWDWKKTSGGMIHGQLRLLGASPDWRREKFTMDPDLSALVTKVFVQLFDEGLIYRDKRLVNWDTALLTAVSDLEVDNQETKGHLWYFRYPIVTDPTRHIVVATTRPETVFGDVAVAVHPDDPRYKDLIGQHVIMPLNGKHMPIIADTYSNPEKGSGAVKITPGHDFNDFDVGRRHNLPMINIMDPTGKLDGDETDIPKEFKGLDRFAARDKVVEVMESLGHLEKIESVVHMVPFGDRSGTILEPRLTDQWFVDAQTLAKPAIDAVRTGRTRFVPEKWTQNYFEWMENIRPWCISRQIWWGHRIPAWYGPDGQAFVAETEKQAAKKARDHYGHSVDLKQDDDVLDTWFSSALWPFATLSWPASTAEFKKYYPTDVLVTGFDIIFFWVARMMMMGLHFAGDVPFRTVYIHALVRDEKGQKMSKSKGNIIDPLELINLYGADSLRFTLAALSVPGRDVKMSENRVEGYRNFATKFWNAARFAHMHNCKLVAMFEPDECVLDINRWIAHEINTLVTTVTESLQAFKFHDVAHHLYHTIWGTFCDGYLELAKIVLTTGHDKERYETRATVAWALRQLSTLLHPFMPYITEEIWQHLSTDTNAPFLMTKKWPKVCDDDFTSSANAISWVIDTLGRIRQLRAELNVPPSTIIQTVIKPLRDETQEWISKHQSILCTLARLEPVHDADTTTWIGVLGDGIDIHLNLRDIINIEEEKSRIKKDIEKNKKEIESIQKKLNNPDFMTKAAEHVIQENKDRLETAAKRLTYIQDTLAQL